MVNTPPIQQILFLDIETVSQHSGYDDLSASWKELWDKKAISLLRNDDSKTSSEIYDRAAIYAEFGKIICISCGLIKMEVTEKKLVLKSFYGDDEKQILNDFCGMLTRWTSGNSKKFLCAHNGKEFDYPYLCRRMVIHDICIPTILQIAGKKPWEVELFDTMEMWKFGDYKSYTSLNLLAHVLNVPSSKDDMDGSQVGHTYWQSHDLERIARYCEKDVITLTNVFLRMVREPLIKAELVEVKEITNDH